MINTQYIKLDMVPSGVMPILSMSQYDIGRPLGVVVYNGGEVVNLDTYTCTVEATRTDGTAITAAVTTDNNIGVFVTTATMTNQADKYLAKLVLFDSNSHRVASLAFVMVVTPTTMDENAESIEEDASLYQQYTGTVQTLIAEIRTDIQRIEDERPYVTPEMYGAYGDGTHDDSTAIQTAIDASLTNGIRLLAKGKTYLVGTGLRIVGSRNQSTLEVESGADIDIDFSTSTIRYTGTDYAFTLSMIKKGWFRFGSIDAASGGGILMQSDSRFNYISYLTISGGSIAANAAKDCITITNSGTGWINQNRIDGIWFMSGLYAVHMISNSTNKINEWIIENVSLEGVENGHFLEAHSESDIAVYIESIKFLYNRAVEHIGNGKIYLKTYGRVQDILIESYYGSFQLPTAYEFQYDTSGTQTYTHIAQKIIIICAKARCLVANGKFVQNPFMYESACNITNISNISNDNGSEYRNFYGTLSEFKSAIPSLYAGLLSGTLAANLNTKWLNGSPTDIESNRKLVQSIITQEGTEFRRKINGSTISDWSMVPLVRTLRQVLHQKTISVNYSTWGLLFISTLSTSYTEVYLVRFGTNDAPLKLYSSDPNITQWTITKQSNFTLYFENTYFSTTELFVAFLQLG